MTHINFEKVECFMREITRSGKIKNKFEKIYSIYAKYLYSIGMNILKDETNASDALQNCFMRVFENIDKIDDVTSKQTKSFVSIIMRNESINIYRENKTQNSVTESMEEALYIIVEGSEVEEIFARAELKKEVEFYLEELNEDDRNIIILKYVKEYSHKEISKIINISIDSVRQRLFRARKKLAFCITKGKEES